MQRNRLAISTCCLAVLSFAVGTGWAQRGPGGPGPGGPGPENRIGFLGFAGGPGGKVVTGAPYCGQVTNTFSQTLGDGNQIHRETTSNVCRDSMGRTYSQMNLPFSDSGSAPGGAIIRDPVAGVDYMLDTTHKTYRKFTEPKPRTANGAKGPRFEGGGPNPGPNGAAATDLGFQTIAGLSCKGTRMTRTIPANSRLGNQQALQITTERWFSPDLSIDIQTQMNDPSRGSDSMTVTNITRTEPDASMFQVPAGYTLQQGGPGGPGFGGHRPRPQ
jgi:hypothetical protein